MFQEQNPAIVVRYELARRIAREAGRTAMGYFRQRDKLVIELKGVQDMVSVADRAVETFVRSQILAAFPDDAVLGEEYGGDRGKADFVWVVDPIDGTACFVNGMFSWCVSVGVVLRGEPVIGVVYDPNADEEFHARAGGGAFCNEAPIRVHPGQTLKDGVLGVGTSFRVGTEDFIPFLERVLLDGGMFIRNGSGALMISYVAAGRLIGYFEPHMNAWDALAGLVLVREAGGATNDFMAGNGLIRGNPMLAGNRKIADRVARHSGLSLTAPEMELC
ncbi:inositol monophosphatase family protein [Pleomorphomonas oryzae]|uniref:inositol monophosphatase family protein n=1 Tax=Pleomorphomonas oryzae TaxID=261934 RepID=UPI00041733FA|nr:inositol monophosphatase family protein [Pleomorphomonas oryzae]